MAADLDKISELVDQLKVYNDGHVEIRYEIYTLFNDVMFGCHFVIRCGCCSVLLYC